MSVDEALQHDNSLREQCVRLLTATDYGYARDSWVQRSILSQVGDLQAQIGSARVRGEVGLLRGRRAVAVALFDEAVIALRMAKSAFQQDTRIPRRVADCWTQLATAYAAQRKYRKAIRALRFARRALRSWGEEQSAELQTEVSLALARCLVTTGRPGRALAELDNALSSYVRQPRDRFRCETVRAEVLAAQGDYEGAERILTKLGRTGDARLDADIADAFGCVLASSGRHELAASSYNRAIQLYEALLGVAEEARTTRRDAVTATEELPSLRASLGTCTMNLGAVYGAVGEHAPAIAKYRTAMMLFEQIPFAGDRMAECQLNIGVEFMADGQSQEAAKEFWAVENFLSRAPELGRLRAGLSMNMGRLLDRLNEHDKAARRHREARQIFLEVGLPEWAARAGINLGSSMSEAQFKQQADEPASSAVDELIPAFLYLDQMRFQFPTAAARSAWRRTVLGANQLAFELAANDARLVAELIENAINSGMHSATRVVPDDDSLLALRERIGGLGDSSQASGTSADGPAVPGASRLVAGAILPMHPPPRIRMPDNRIVLDGFLKAAQRIYGQTRHFGADRVVAVCPVQDGDVSP